MDGESAFVWTEPGPSRERSEPPVIYRWASLCVGKCGCGSVVEEETASEEEAEREKALLSGGGLSSLCLSWDSSAALNMPVIFNRRRHGAAPAPLLQNILSARRGSGERSRSSRSHDPAQQEGEVETDWRRRGGGAAPEPRQLLRSSARPDEAFRSNQMLRRQRAEESRAELGVREEVRAWVRRGGGPPGLEASKKKRRAEKRGELGKMCFSACLTRESQGLPMSSPC